MKIVGIGDLLIPCGDLEQGFRRLDGTGIETRTVTWKLRDYEELQSLNLQVEQGGSEVVEPEDYILEAVGDADMVITQFCPITRRVIDACPNLKAIGVLRGGVENVNVAYASEKGILVLNTPGRNANAVADFTVGMMISECRNIARAHRELKAGRWVRDYANAASVPDLCEKTAGLVGYGNIGRKVAKRLRAFDMHVLVYDPFLPEGEKDVEAVTLEELMRRSDFVSLHARMTKDTYHMIDARMIGLMKPTAYLINTARSGLVDEDALTEALRERRIAGAALDVFDLEPPDSRYKMLPLDNVTVTPHLAGGTRDAFTHSPALLAEELKKLLIDKQWTRFMLNADACRNNALLRGVSR